MAAASKMPLWKKLLLGGAGAGAIGAGFGLGMLAARPGRQKGGTKTAEFMYKRGYLEHEIMDDEAFLEALRNHARRATRGARDIVRLNSAQAEEVGEKIRFAVENAKATLKPFSLPWQRALMLGGLGVGALGTGFGLGMLAGSRRRNVR